MKNTAKKQAATKGDRNVRDRAVRVYVQDDLNVKFKRAAQIKRTSVSSLIAMLTEPQVDHILAAYDQRAA